MEERDHKTHHTSQQQASSYTPATVSVDHARMPAFQPAIQVSPAPAKMHGASPVQSQQQSQVQQQQQQVPSQHYYPQTNGHHQAPQPQPATPQHDYRVQQQNGTAMPSVSLPPIQHFEPTQNAMQQPHYAQMNGGDAHNYAPQQVPYQYQNGVMQAIMPSNNQVVYAGRDAFMDRRYTPPPPLHPYPHALPQHMQLDPRQMSGGRHKKEIKRRTKTGCLTCRKRRIKCDERHPACRNCEKSKRECLGYDPIFKPQPTPAAIQPAPKHENNIQMSFAHQQYQPQEDIYNQARGPPPPPVQQTNGYQTHYRPEASTNSAAPHHTYHPPFEMQHKEAITHDKQ